MKYTVAIELVVDEERVAEEQAQVVSMGANCSDVTQRKDTVHLLGLRKQSTIPNAKLSRDRVTYNSKSS